MNPLDPRTESQIGATDGAHSPVLDPFELLEDRP